MLASQPEEVLQLQERPKWGWQKTGVRLPEHLTATLKNRIEREAHNIFRRGYGPATHARFRRVLNCWMSSASDHSSALADLYRKILNPDAEGGYRFSGPNRIDERRYFLTQFFRRDPALKSAFKKWMASLREPAAPK